MYQPKPTQPRSCLVSVALFVYTMSALISQELIVQQISPIVLMIQKPETDTGSYSKYSDKHLKSSLRMYVTTGG